MGRLISLSVRNYRSIGDWVRIHMPEKGPLVIFGENNAGKSNIIRALDIVLGETWPGSFHPEDHDFHLRDPQQTPIQVNLQVDDVMMSSRAGTMAVAEFLWAFDPEDGDRPCRFDVGDAQGAVLWGNSACREQLACAIVGADRRLHYQLSYTSKWTLLARLMRKFHERLVADPDRVDRLQASFDSVVAIFHEVEEFSRFGDELRRMAGEFASNLKYGLDLDFSAYDPSNYYRSLRVQPTSDGQVRSFDELGTGQEQILAVAFAYAFARAYAVGDAGLVMVIEEPEAHLHPLAQEWLGRKISELHGDGVQMIVTTHSPAFVDLGNPGALACVRKGGIDGETIVTQHSRRALAESLQQRGASGATGANIGPFYAASATSEHVAGMFARACVVVEGPSEALALPQLLDTAGLDLLALGIAVIPAGGVGAIARWLRLYEAYGIPSFAVFDSDSRDDPDGLRRRDLLLALGEDETAYAESVRNLEGLLVADGYAVFCPDFEVALRSMLPGYDHLEEAARAEVGATKPLVAREACRRLGIERGDGVRQSFNELATAILQRAEPAECPET